MIKPIKEVRERRESNSDVFLEAESPAEKEVWRHKYLSTASWHCTVTHSLEIGAYIVSLWKEESIPAGILAE